MAIARTDVEFTKDGSLFREEEAQRVLDSLAAPTDLLVLAHGWNNDMAEARDLYANLLKSIEKVASTGVVGGLDGRELAAVGLFWPSKKFTDDDLIPGGGAASATAAQDKSLDKALDRLEEDPERLGSKEKDPVLEATMERARSLVDQLATSEAARREYVFLLRTAMDPSAAEEDDGSLDFLIRDPEELFRELSQPVQAPSATGGGGATSVSGGAAGLGDLFDGVKAAARRMANFTTYYRMKDRAGKVGRQGVAELLRRIRRAKPDIRLHLIGHSFGGRLVTAAAHALSPSTPNVTVTLLQAAFSHNGLAQKFDGKKDGFFRALLSEKRASGPVVITHTKNDKAVGVAYPLASRIARQKAAAIGDENDPYGGMGRNGAQHTPEASKGRLLDVGESYTFQTGKVYNLRADQFIKDHGDVTGHQVACAILHAIAAR